MPRRSKLLAELGPFLLILAAGVGLPGRAVAQVASAYVDDSVTATESFQRLPDLLASGNAGEALRVVQRLLEEEGDRLVVSSFDPEVFAPVRGRVHALLLSDATLLARYRQLEGPAGERLLQEGKLESLERSRLLTTAGFEATLRLATLDFEAARFDGAVRRLSQLQTHPDLTAGNAGRAAALAARLTAYTASRAARDLAEALAASAGAKPSPEPAVAVPPRARIISPNPGADQGPLDRSAVSAEPLASAPIASFARSSKPGAERLALAWSIPTIAGETLYTNDGMEVAAWDRWTLVPLWRQAAAADDPDAPSLLETGNGVAFEQATRSLEDASTVTVGSGVVIATTGFAISNARRSGDAGIHAFDPGTGAPLWVAELATLDRQLIDASPRGAIQIVGDTAVVSADRYSAGRRLATSLLVGLDCSTGRLRWIRTLANLGLPPIGQMPRPADQPASAEGVVYLTDALGVTAAVEAATGRFLWVHRLTSAMQESGYVFTRRNDALPWLGATVVVEDSTILTIEPGTGDLLRLAKSDGRIVARRILGRGEPNRSLIRVGDFVAAVNSVSVNFYPLKDLLNGPMEQVAIKSALAGRPILSDGSLVVPVDDGLLIARPGERGVQQELLPLPTSGHPVLSDGRLLIASMSSVQSFQSWEALEPKLRAAIETRPKDPAPGLAYVGIALKAGKAAGVPAVADRLLSLLDSDPTDSTSQDARRRLFELLRAAVAGVRDAGPAMGAEAQATIQLTQVDQLVTRLGRAADTPAERTEHLLLASWAADAQSRSGAAVDALQQILQNADLADAVISPGAGPSPGAAPGWQAARERLTALLARVGFEPYAPFDAQAQRELASATGSPDAAEALARRYPASRAAVVALSAAAETRLSENSPRRAMEDLGAALEAARTVSTASRLPLQPEAAVAAGRLLSLLADAGREGEAARLLSSLETAAPALALTDRGKPVDRAELASRLRTTLAGRDRRPIVGDTLLPRPQILSGWLPSPARFTAGPGTATDLLPMYAPASRQVALWARRPEDGRLAPLWLRAAEPRTLPPSFLRVDHDAAYILWPGEKGPSVECVGADGVTRWRTPPLDALLPAENPAAPLRTPQDGDVDPLNTLFLFHERTLVLVRRTGAAAAFDLSSGKSAWARRLEVSGVYDLAAASNRLVVLGEFEGPRQPRIVFHNLADGQPAAVLGDEKAPLTSSPRWVRAFRDRLILGMADSVWGVEASTAAPLWRISGASAINPKECWTTPTRAIILGGDGRPWMFDPMLETPKQIALESEAGLADLRRRQGPDDSNVSIVPGPSGTIAVVTERGVKCLDQGGAVVGFDALPAGDVSYLTAVADRHVVFLQNDAEADREGLRRLKLSFVELPGGAVATEVGLPMFDAPTRVALMDGKVIISAGPAASPVALVFDAVPTAQAR